MKRFLVTGANGFVGKSLCRALTAKGFEVIRVARKTSDGNAVPVGDINGTTDWSGILQGADVVIHLAAHVHQTEAPATSSSIFHEVNSEGTANLARQAASAKVKRFVFVSSIKVNGERTEEGHPFKETDLPRPEDAYGISKLEAELALSQIAEETGMDIVVVRPPLVYGPGVKANFLNLLKLITRDIPLPLGAIKNGRSLIYVENLVDALVLSATHPNAVGEIYLVSDGPAISTPALIKGLARALGKKGRIFFLPLTPLRLLSRLLHKSSQFDKLVQSLEVDSSKIRRQLEWIPPYTTQQGLFETAKWFKDIKQEGQR